MDVSTSVTIIAALIFVNTIFIVAAIVRLIKTLGEVQKLAEMDRLQLAPMTHDVTQIVGDIRSIVRTADKEMDKVGDSLTAVRDTARSLREFEATIHERIERPLLDLATILSAIVKGGAVFWKHFSKR